MINVQNAILEEEYKTIYKFLQKLNEWYDSENNSYDNLTKLYYNRLMGSLYGLISYYRENEYIDIEYCLQLIRDNMYGLMEDYRKQNDSKYRIFKAVYCLLYDIEKR